MERLNATKMIAGYTMGTKPGGREPLVEEEEHSLDQSRQAG